MSILAARKVRCIRRCVASWQILRRERKRWEQIEGRCRFVRGTDDATNRPSRLAGQTIGRKKKTAASPCEVWRRLGPHDISIDHPFSFHRRRWLDACAVRPPFVRLLVKAPGFKEKMAGQFMLSADSMAGLFFNAQLTCIGLKHTNSFQKGTGED